MKKIILQDGTNSFLNFERKPRDVFEQYKQLVKLCREKINPDKFYLMTVIPMRIQARIWQKKDVWCVQWLKQNLLRKWSWFQQIDQRDRGKNT